MKNKQIDDHKHSLQTSNRVKKTLAERRTCGERNGIVTRGEASYLTSASNQPMKAQRPAFQLMAISLEAYDSVISAYDSSG